MITETTYCSSTVPLVSKDSGTGYTLVPPWVNNQSFQWGKNTCTTTYEFSISPATNTPEIIGGFTKGEIITSFWCFMIFTIVVMGIFLFKYTK